MAAGRFAPPCVMKADRFMKFNFAKMHGLGNDMILIDDRDNRIEDVSAFAQSILHRNTGVGADSLLVVRNSDTADIRMLILNIDGSEAEMCGNGIRCFVKFVIEHGIITFPNPGGQRYSVDFTVETLSGVKRPHAEVENGIVVSIGVDMGEPRLDCADIPVAAEGEFREKNLYSHGRRFTVTSVNTGVPHTVAFVSDAALTEVEYYGRDIEHSPIFPRRTNVDFVQVIDRENIIMRAWERGCGCTMCCGTGACASVVACILAGKTDRRVNVHVEIGTLVIEWREDNTLYMSGPAATICEGVYCYSPAES